MVTETDGQLTSVKNINGVLINIRAELEEIEGKIETIKYGGDKRDMAAVPSYDDGLNGLVGRAFNILGYVQSINHSLDVLVEQRAAEKSVS